MPKILKNVREQLLAEAKKQIFERGYSKTTIRSVASACGLGVGTVYNYFSSKDMLIASFMAEDWLCCLEKMKEGAGDSVENALKGIYLSLCEFYEKHRTLFLDPGAVKVFSSVFSQRHAQLRSQLAGIILPFCTGRGQDAEFLSQFVAESLLTWSLAGKSFDEQYKILCKLFN